MASPRAERELEVFKAFYRSKSVLKIPRCDENAGKSAEVPGAVLMMMFVPMMFVPGVYSLFRCLPGKV